MKPFWEITEEEVEACLSVTKWHPASREYMRGGGYSSQFSTRGEMPVTMCRLNLVKRSRSGIADCRRLDSKFG